MTAAASGPFFEAVRKGVLAAPRPTEVDGAVRDLVAAAEGEVVGVVFFGSRRTGAARADPWSAHDFFVLVRSYHGAYAALRRSGKTGKNPAIMAVLNVVLPPNQVSLRLGDGGIHAKCSVIAVEAFERETSPRRRDHFCIGRLFQPSQILYAADPEIERRILAALVSAHAETYGWVRPWLPPRFDAPTYCRTALRVSLAREIRPEPEGRAEALWAAQGDEQIGIYERLLAELAARGELRAVEGPAPSAGPEGGPTVPAGAPVTYASVRPVTAGERLRLTAYFGWSLLRATVRWLKHVLTFENWLDYILRKVARHTGEEIVLTPRERRLPFVFLWPRLFRYLRRKDEPRGRA
jgi:hypothetical protein